MLLGLVAFILIAMGLEKGFGLPFDTTYRIACGAGCLLFIYKLGMDYPGEQWPRISFLLALLVNAGLFFTPLMDRPASRGELILFALPDAIVVLAALIASYPVVDEHQRAMRQQMVLGLVAAVAFCVILFASMLMEPHATHR